MKKKGISAVVTTVLIILLSIIAVIILWAAIRPTLQSTAGRADTALKCTELSLDISSCTSNDTAYITTITREGGADNIDVKVSFSDADSSLPADISEVGPLDTRTVSVDKATLDNGVVSVQAAAVLEDETICTPIKKTCT